MRRPSIVAAVAATLAVFVSGAYAGAASAQGTVEPIAQNCEELAVAGNNLTLHNGFQEGPRCVEPSHGEVPAEAQGASLLIVDAPRRVRSGDDITMTVSTRNILRDRFLAAGQGGYYLESSVLTADGIVRGHFHAGCRVLDGGDFAPTPQRSLVFKAVEDGRGGIEPDSVTITFQGKDAAGQAIFKKGQNLQCAAWAGDGSHRTPMMQFANQIPAIDSVRVEVRGDGGQGRREKKDDREGKQR